MRPDQSAKAMTATATSRPPTMEVAALPAELTLTGGTPVGVTVGPTGVLVGLGADVVLVMAVVPERSVLGGGVKVKVAVVTVEFWNPGPVVVWLFAGGTTYVVVVVTGGGVWTLRVHGQLVMVIVVGVVTV